MDRNPNGPVFNPTIYQRNLVEDIAIGSSVVDVNATDADGVSASAESRSLSGDWRFYHLSEW